MFRRHAYTFPGLLTTDVGGVYAQIKWLCVSSIAIADPTRQKPRVLTSVRDRNNKRLNPIILKVNGGQRWSRFT